MLLAAVSMVDMAHGQPADPCTMRDGKLVTPDACVKERDVLRSLVRDLRMKREATEVNEAVYKTERDGAMTELQRRTADFAKREAVVCP